jgi:hypothetical protein
MSARIRLLWVIPALLIASWLAVRSIAASAAEPRDALGDPPGPFASLSYEVSDPALSKLIARFAADARRVR